MIMINDRIRFTLLSLLLALLVGCGNDSAMTASDRKSGQAQSNEHGGHVEAAQSEDGNHEDSEGPLVREDVQLSAEEADAAGIRVARADRGVISVQLELPAEIRADADRVARLSPQVDGIVAQLFAGEGDTVVEGEALARLNSRELAGLKADYLNTLSAERLARAELEREQNLWEKNITSEADLQSARAAFSAANAAREAAENRLHAIGVDHDVLDRLNEASDGALAHAFVVAPIAGQIIERRVSLGESVSAGDEPMFILLDDSVVWADIAVYKEDLASVREGQTVSLQGENGQPLAEGAISFLFPVIDEASRTATARVIVENAEHKLRPGQFVTARIDAASSSLMVRVPSDAIVDVEGETSVFVPSGTGFAPRAVQAGQTSAGYTAIHSGLGEGEAFVSEGAFTLKAQLEKDAFGDGHAH